MTRIGSYTTDKLSGRKEINLKSNGSMLSGATTSKNILPSRIPHNSEPIIEDLLVSKETKNKKPMNNPLIKKD